MTDRIHEQTLQYLPDRSYRTADGVWAGQYGAFDVAARYAGLPAEPSYRFGEWQHGWLPPEDNVHPEWVVGSSGTSRYRQTWRHKYWVFREDQACYLQQQGYRYARAIGHALVYLPKPRVERIPGSLLIMPPHSIPQSSNEWDSGGYLAYVAQIRSRFSHVAACVSRHCIENGYWVQEFADLGIPVIEGAQVSDRNSLDRMAVLFSRFEYVTMTALGSQLPYSAYFGAKASICGPEVPLRREDLAGMDFYKSFPEGIDITLRWGDRRVISSWFPQFFTDPWTAVPNPEWAAHQLGEPSKLSPQDLKRELRWTMPMQTLGAMIDAGRSVRRRLRST